MVPSAITALAGAVRPDRLRHDLSFFATIRRDSGGEGEAAAADYIAAQLSAIGLPVLLHRYRAFHSYPRRARVVLDDGRTDVGPALTHSFAQPTAPGGLAAPVVAVDGDDFARARGALALVEGLAAPVRVLRASRAGCAGVVFVNQDAFVHNMIATTIWGTPGLDQVALLPSVTVVSVPPEAGIPLRSAAAKGETVVIHADVDTGWYDALLPEVRFPATDASQFALVGGHYCAWDVGVTDNATGIACLLEVCRVLQDVRPALRRGIRVCWWPGHSHGRYSGSTWYADQFFTELAEGALAYYNIDSPGVRGATRYVARHTSAELQAHCLAAIATVTGQGEAPVHRPTRAADQSFLANGVPSFSAYPFLPEGHPDHRPWTGGSGTAWWWHTSDDTLDKADVEVLAKDTQLALHAVTTLVTCPRLPHDYRAVAAEVVDTLRAYREPLSPFVDLQPACAEAEALLASLDACAGRSLDDDRHNRLALRLGRLLNPVIYSRGGRFAHDAAEWVPSMRPTKGHLLPALAAAVGVTMAVDEAGFMAAQLLRERNRVVTALRDARRAVAAVAADARAPV